MNNFTKYLSPIRIFKHLKHLINYRPYQIKLARWEKAKANNGELVIKIDKDVRIKLYTDSILCELINKGGFEDDEREFIKRFLRKGDVFFDIGANIGLFSLIASGKVGAEGTVYSFEPSNKTYLRLIENIKLNNLRNIYPQKAALSDQCGTLELHTSLNGYDAWNSLAKPLSDGEFAAESVSTIILDSFIQQLNIDINKCLFKIDVEGWELNVLKGAEKILIDNLKAPLIIEFSDSTAQAAGLSCAELYSFLDELGYKFYFYDHQQNRLLLEPLRKTYDYLNLIATKDIFFLESRLK